MKVSGNDLFVTAMKKEGVDTIFAYPGGMVVNLLDALHDCHTGIDPENRCECGAVFEQAIHLARKPPCSGPKRRLVSEEISGVGRRAWEYGDTEEPDYAPRALKFMEAARRRNFRIGRG